MFKLLKLQILLVLLAVLVVAGLAADQLFLRPKAESAIDAAVTRGVPGTTGVRTHISALPFVPRVLATGRVPELRVAASTSRPKGVPVTLRDLEIVVTDVVIDRAAALQGRAEVRSIGAGTARAALAPGEVVKLLGVPGLDVKVAGGAATATVAGRGVAQLLLGEGRLEVKVGGVRLARVALPASDLLPCAPTAAFQGDALVLSCSFTKVPDVLVDLANRAAAARR